MLGDALTIRGRMSRRASFLLAPEVMWKVPMEGHVAVEYPSVSGVCLDGK